MATLIGTIGDDTLQGDSSDDTIRGLAGDDRLLGQAGDDLLEGGEGWDRLDGGLGDDQLVGGAGYDTLRDLSGGNDTLLGGDYIDYLYVQRSGAQLASSVRMEGGEGNDSLTFWGAQRVLDRVIATGGEGDDDIDVQYVRSSDIRAGAGNDNVTVGTLGGEHTVRLGGGSDQLELARTYGSFATGNRIQVRDFETGAGGDRLEFADYLADALYDWSTEENPFATGHLRLSQAGDAVLLQVDRDGEADEWGTLARFANCSVADFLAENLGGYEASGAESPALILTGGDAPDTLLGNNGDDSIFGGAADDSLLGRGGNDRLDGGDGWDRLDGGFGDDLLLGGGNYDTLQDFLGGNDTLKGGDYIDYLYIQRSGDQVSSQVALDGGEGDDSIRFWGAQRSVDSVSMRGGSGDDDIDVQYVRSARINAGEGDDHVTIGSLGGSFSVRLGTGDDVLELARTFGSFAVGNHIRVRGFDTGAEGDRFDFSGYLTDVLQGWSGETNPFEDGYLRLWLKGDNTLFQIDRDGGGDAWGTLVTFVNLTPEEFTDENLSGYSASQAGIVA